MSKQLSAGLKLYYAVQEQIHLIYLEADGDFLNVRNLRLHMCHKALMTLQRDLYQTGLLWHDVQDPDHWHLTNLPIAAEGDDFSASPVVIKFETVTRSVEKPFETPWGAMGVVSAETRQCTREVEFEW